MLTIARLFGKSPFGPLQTHMHKVSACINKLTSIFDRLGDTSSNVLEDEVKALSKLEHEADLTKNDIRNHLPKTLFLPIDRHALLEILSIQDKIADKAEDIGNLLVLHPLKKSDLLMQDIIALYKKNEEAFYDTRQIVNEISDLLESTFGGKEAERVKTMADSASFKEYEADKLKHELLKNLFKVADSLPMPAFYIYTRLIEEINDISHIAEKLAHRIRMILESK